MRIAIQNGLKLALAGALALSLCHCGAGGTPALSSSNTDTGAGSAAGNASGGNLNPDTVTDVDSHTVGGTVTGLSGVVILQNNSGDNLSVSANGSFTFVTAVTNGAAYSVTVFTNPNGQTCTANSNTGAVSGADITNVTVTCANVVNSFTVGGTISGQSGSLVLQNNSGNNLTVAATATTFTFTTKVATGAGYSVTVKTLPSGQTCSITHASGTMSGANITNVAVVCTTPAPSDPYAIGLTASDWDIISDGDNGANGVIYDASGILLTPKTATFPADTHAPWVLAKTTETTPLQNFKATITYTNIAQLRTGSAPNAWEVFWLFFNYTIGSDGKKQTNYLVIKPEGTEVGRAFNELGQAFLVTNDTPTITIGSTHTITVTKIGTQLTVLLDGAPAASFTSDTSSDPENYIYNVPGAIGLYCEDAKVRISSVKIQPL